MKPISRRKKNVFGLLSEDLRFPMHGKQNSGLRNLLHSVLLDLKRMTAYTSSCRSWVVLCTILLGY